MANFDEGTEAATEIIFASAQRYAAAAIQMVLTEIYNFSTIPVFPSTNVSLPDFSSPPIGGEVITIPPFNAPNIIIKTFPTPDFSQVWSYSSAFLTALKTWMDSEITMGGTGLTETAQNDWFNSGNEKDLQTLSEQKNKVAIEWAKSNWGKMDGILLAAIAHTDKIFTDIRYGVSKDIRLECEKIILGKLKIALEKGLVLEQALESYMPAMAQTMAHAYGAEVQAYKTEIEAQIKILGAFINNYTAILKGRSAAVKAGIVSDSMLIDYAEALFAKDAANAEIAVSILDLNLSVALADQHLSNTRSAGITQIGAQLFAGAISSCHMQAHLGSSGSTSNDTVISTSASVSHSTADITNNITDNRS